MAPSSFKKISAAAVCATAVRAATVSYQLSEEYTAENFFDKFDFFTSTYTSGDSWDDTHGYVQYRGQADAESLGLISTSSGGIYIGPDANSTYDPTGTGRDSVRITSKAMYNEGLMIAKFSHMPVQACGAWPAFWSFGSPWLTMGEIDYFEGWNLMGYNRMAMHTNETIAGACSLTTTGIQGTVMTQDCNNKEDGTGCGVQDASGVWGSTTGATFAMEWTDSAIKIWSWLPSAVPSDITAGSPDPTSSAWGNPTLLVEQANCDLSKSFGNQQLVFDIDFCGDTAGSPTFWNQTCSAQVGDTCANYVANNPSAFAETYFMVEGIQYYQLGEPVASVTASASLLLPTASSAAAAGLLTGAGSVLESTLDATSSTSTFASTSTSTSTSAPNAAVTEAVQSFHHTTSYIYGTSTSTDEFGSETTVVVVVDTTICPVTAAEASQSSMLASESSIAVAAQTTPASQALASATNSPGGGAAASTSLTSLTSYSTSTSVKLTTSTFLATTMSTITSCASAASASCSVGDVTAIVKVSTTVCPVTAAEASASRKASSIVAPASSIFSIPALSGSATTEDSPVQATASSDVSLSTSISKSTAFTTSKSTLTGAAAAAASATLSFSTGSTSSASGTTEVISATETDGGLEVATGTPTSISLDWMTQATAAASVAAYHSGNGTITSSSASATQTDNCSGLDCIVVSSSGSKTDVIGAGALALAAFAGAMFMF